MRLVLIGFSVILSIVAIFLAIEGLESLDPDTPVAAELGPGMPTPTPLPDAREELVSAGGETIGQIWDFWVLLPYILFALVATLGLGWVLYWAVRHFAR